MRKLTITFNDGSKVKYTIKDFVAWEPYYNRHAKSSIKSAILQQYPKKDNKPLVLVKDGKEIKQEG